MLTPLRSAVSFLYSAVFNLLEWPMLAIQRTTGMQRIAWAFLLPNLVIFGAFTFLPIFLNFFYATTGSDNILLQNRPYVGLENFRSLLACQNWLEPNSCERDIFWRAIHNSFWFVILQVGFMVAFSLVTALILNRDIPLRGFFRSVFFYPVLLSPVVVALIWKWVLQRYGVLNAGLENFRSLTACPNWLEPNSCERDIFWRAIHNSFWFVLLQVGFMILFSLVTALILNRDLPARGFFRAVFFFPVLLSPVVVALIWKWVLQRYGLLNAGLESAGLPAVNWLLDAEWAFFWIVFVSIWAHMGFYTLILLAGLQAIPSDVYEAAEMDGASKWRTFSRITMPLLMPTMVVVLVLSLIRAVQAFDEIFVLTGGGPGSATLLILQFIYETGFAFQPRLYGLAAAASILMAAVLMVLTLIQLRATRGRAEG